MKRSKIIAGNWKMNLGLKESQNLAQDISNSLESVETLNTRIVIAPTFTNLYPVYHHTRLDKRMEVAAQNMHQSSEGAFTGEISAQMLKDVGVTMVILGHSERRAYFNETNEVLAEKVKMVLDNEMETIFCFGEQLEDRQKGNHFKVVEKQLDKSLFELSVNDWKSIILAYEPIWAIGTGETATPEQAQEMHSFVRQLLTDKYSKDMAERVSILYGGSVKPGNALEIFKQPDVDGGLIGGAALRASDFVDIIKCSI